MPCVAPFPVRRRVERVVSVCSLTLALTVDACSGSEPPANAENPPGANAGRPAAGNDGSNPAAGGGGAPSASGGTGGGAAGNVAASPASGGAPGAAGTSAAAGSGGEPAQAGSAASGASGGAGGAAAGGMAAAAPDCPGKPWPPRALGPNVPFDVGPKAGGLPEYWPTEAWKMETPDKLGLDPAKLMAAADFSTPFATTQAVFVVRHGYVALEKYSGGFSATQQHESYSMAKSFTSGLVGIAIAEGKIMSTDDKICAAYPMEWDCNDATDPRSRITIEHAMNLTTGLEWSENWHSNATGTNDAFSFNMLDTVLSREATQEPGMNKRYSTGDPALLTGVIQQATGQTAYAYAKEKIFDVIGIPNVRWGSDRSMQTTTYAGLQATASEYAKYGYLYLNRGLWDGAQVIPSEWVDRTTQATNRCGDWNQWLWHINPPVRLGTQPDSCTELFCPPTEFANFPHDAFFAEGINGQFIFIVPSADLVVVRLGADQAGSENWDDFARGFLLAILDSVM
ncbi:MAG: serine hydrolase [Polyangiales bacterium]